MGEEKKLEARAKINLTLNVTGRRPNGYHDLELIFQPVSLCDILTVSLKEEPGLDFTCSVKAFENSSNLVCRAYDLLAKRYPGVKGLRVHLEKHIPSGAGMGGGSTDASALILEMNRMFDLGMTWEKLVELGAGLGADVPACMLTRASFGRGIGEELTVIDTHLSYPLLVLKPEVSFSTAEMYRAIDESGEIRQQYRSEAVIKGLEQGDLESIAANLYNVFEEAVPGKQQIQQLKQELLDCGALGSLMTGSGSCVFGIFRDKESRDRAYEQLKNRYEAYACEAVNL